MLSNGFDVPLHLELDGSKIFLGFQLFVHLLAIVALGIPSAVPLSIRLTIIILLVFSALYYLYKYQQSSAFKSIWVWQKGNSWIEVSKGNNRIWQCQQSNLITPWFVIVRLRNEHNTYSLLITKDQCQKNLFRRLSVRLKYFQGDATSPTAAV